MKISLCLVVILTSCIALCHCFPVNSNEQQQQDKECDKKEEAGNVVNSLLSTLLRQTLYNRMENLLLDPGRKSFEKQRIVEAAVENYQQQEIAGESERSKLPTDFSKLAGYWIRAAPGPKVQASIEDNSGTNVPSASEISFQTEEYNITDLFTTTTAKGLKN